MARPLRIRFKNAYYHVMTRGAARCPTFSRPEHGNLFLALLEDSVARFGLEVLCYCLMSHHYHLLVKTPHANLDRVMRHIGGVYTQRFNRLGNRDGPLFRDDIKQLSSTLENYLVSASRYIHHNPIEAGLCKVPQQYKGSTYKAYLGEAPKPKWLSID
jgi:REP element-mobilizing transposase RayT